MTSSSSHPNGTQPRQSAPIFLATSRPVSSQCVFITTGIYLAIYNNSGCCSEINEATVQHYYSNFRLDDQTTSTVGFSKLSIYSGFVIREDYPSSFRKPVRFCARKSVNIRKVCSQDEKQIFYLVAASARLKRCVRRRNSVSVLGVLLWTLFLRVLITLLSNSPRIAFV